jgi:hypothetical protein
MAGAYAQKTLFTSWLGTERERLTSPHHLQGHDPSDLKSPTKPYILKVLPPPNRTVAQGSSLGVVFQIHTRASIKYRTLENVYI